MKEGYVMDPWRVWTDGDADSSVLFASRDSNAVSLRDQYSDERI